MKRRRHDGYCAVYNAVKGPCSCSARTRPRIPRAPSRGEELMLQHLNAWQAAHGEDLNVFREFVFHPDRKWRFDFAILPGTHRKIAIEIEGVTRFGNHLGRHQTPAGLEADAEKYNEALCFGWRVLRVTEAQVKSGQALAWLDRLLGVNFGT